jgi:hypothetical protein
VTFYEVVTAAIADFMRYGFDSQKRLDFWIEKLREAAVKSLITEKEMQKEIERSLGQAYSRLVTKGGLINDNVSKFTLDKLKPKLRAELDRRIMASANLIKYNREETISNTLRRFAGWATSIPIGGTDIVDKKKEKKNIRKDLATIDFKERRVIIDQTHKLINNINEIVAVDNGAIAARWHSNWRQANYNYREDHKELDGVIYLVRGSWAVEKRLIKAVNGYTDEVIAPGEAVFCRCRYVYIYKIKDLPEDFLTTKGKKELQSEKQQ